MDQRKVWDNISESWSNFRQKPIRNLENLNWETGKILDIGCGNCRNLLPFKKLECYGVDFSPKMIENAKKFCKKNNLNVNLKKGNVVKLPFKNNFFDYILSIAVLHHLKNPELGIKEIYRVLKPKGQVYITTWNKLQLKFLFKKKETYIGWGKEKRYYNFISFFEMRRILKKNNFKILKSKLFGKNIEFLIEK